MTQWNSTYEDERSVLTPSNVAARPPGSNSSASNKRLTHNVQEDSPVIEKLNHGDLETNAIYNVENLDQTNVMNASDQMEETDCIQNIFDNAGHTGRIPLLKSVHKGSDSDSNRIIIDTIEKHVTDNGYKDSKSSNLDKTTNFSCKMDITIPDVNLKNDCTTQSGLDTFSNLFASAGVKKMEKENDIYIDEANLTNIDDGMEITCKMPDIKALSCKNGTLNKSVHSPNGMEITCKLPLDKVNFDLKKEKFESASKRPLQDIKDKTVEIPNIPHKIIRTENILKPETIKELIVKKATDTVEDDQMEMTCKLSPPGLVRNDFYLAKPKCSKNISNDMEITCKVPKIDDGATHEVHNRSTFDKEFSDNILKRRLENGDEYVTENQDIWHITSQKEKFVNSEIDTKLIDKGKLLQDDDQMEMTCKILRPVSAENRTASKESHCSTNSSNDLEIVKIDQFSKANSFVAQDNSCSLKGKMNTEESIYVEPDESLLDVKQIESLSDKRFEDQVAITDMEMTCKLPVVLSVDSSKNASIIIKSTDESQLSDKPSHDRADIDKCKTNITNDMNMISDIAGMKDSVTTSSSTEIQDINKASPLIRNEEFLISAFKDDKEFNPVSTSDPGFDKERNREMLNEKRHKKEGQCNMNLVDLNKKESSEQNLNATNSITNENNGTVSFSDEPSSSLVGKESISNVGQKEEPFIKGGSPLLAGDNIESKLNLNVLPSEQNLKSYIITDNLSIKPNDEIASSLTEPINNVNASIHSNHETSFKSEIKELPLPSSNSQSTIKHSISEIPIIHNEETPVTVTDMKKETISKEIPNIDLKPQTKTKDEPILSNAEPIIKSIAIEKSTSIFEHLFQKQQADHLPKE